MLIDRVRAVGGSRWALVVTLATTMTLGVSAARATASPPLSGPMPACSVPCISVGDSAVSEGDAGTRTLVFPVTLSQPSSTAVSVQYRVVNGSATGSNLHTAGIDYNNAKGATKTLTFALGPNGFTKTSASVSVTVWGDTTPEPDETLRVLLSNPTGGAVLARPLAVGTVLDDDNIANSDIHVAVGDSSVIEGTTGKARNLSFPITLSNPATSAVTLSYTISSSTAQWSKTATPGADFGGNLTGTVKFPLGLHGTPTLKRVNVPVWPDAIAESDEIVTLTITGSLPAGVSISRAAGSGTIVDDDATPTTSPVPNSMAVLGDSISRGFNACPVFGECLPQNWSTGTDPAVDSHYSRILAVNPAIAGHAFNDAVSGARMSNLVGQAANAISQNVDYITIEMGGNDACTSSEALMTPAATYQSQFQQAMTNITNALPNTRIFVASVPDIKQLWVVAKDDANARNIWSTFGICASMTANPLSTAQADVDRRDRVRQRVIDYNTALATVCAQYTNCRFDQNLIFDQQFALSDISSTDYFHPSLAGQTQLAIATYAAGWNW